VASFNRIILIGELVGNPESRSSMEGSALTKFKLSVTRPGGVGNDLIDVVAWRDQAEAASQNFKQGDLVLVEGKIQVRSFQNQAGERNWATEVVANKVQLFGGKKVSAPAAVSSGTEVEELPEDDLPF